MMPSLNKRESFPRFAHWILPLLGCCCFAGFVRAGSADGSPHWKRLKSEAPQAWKRYQDFCWTLQGTSSGGRQHDIGAKSTTDRLRQSWKQCGNNVLNEIESLEAGIWTGSIVAENPHYNFRVLRRGENKHWVILEVKKLAAAHNNEELRKPEALGLQFSEPSVRLPLLVQSPAFQPIDVSVVLGDKSEELVRVKFKYSPADPEKDALRGGILVFDPAHDWILRNADLDSERATGKVTDKAISSFHYKEGPDNHPIMTKSEIRRTIKQNGKVLNEIFAFADYDLHIRTSIPESEFTLTAFDLPEPHWARSTTGSWFWLGIAGIVCLVLGALVMWIKRRRAVILP